MSTKKILSRATLLAILLAQLVYLIFCGHIKAQGGMHIDEIYSYILSNSYDGDQMVNMPKYFDRWIEPSSLLDTVTVQDGEQFAYDKVYYNNSLDCHPPLFYFLLHSICSLFPNHFSIWYGIGLNLCFFVFSTIMLYILGLQMLKDDCLALVPPLIWGFSRVCLDAVLFVRMYMVLSFFVLCLVAINYQLIKNPLSIGAGILLFVISFLGSFTHYYFLVFNFFLTLSYCLYKLFNKDYKALLLYGTTVLASVVLLFVSYPYVISQAFGSSTNNVGTQVAQTIGNFSQLPKQAAITIVWIVTQLFTKYVTCTLFIGICLLLCIALFKRNATGKHLDRASTAHLITLGDFVFYAIPIGMTTLITAHLSGIFYTTRYIFDLMPLYVLLITLLFAYLLEKTHLTHWGIPALLTLGILNSSVFIAKHECTYYFSDQTEKLETIATYPQTDCIVLNAKSHQDNKTGYSNPIPTNNVFTFQLFNQVYMTSYTDAQTLDAVLEKSGNTDSVMIYLATDKSWIDGYDAHKITQDIMADSKYLKQCHKVEKMPFGILYYFSS